MAARTIWDVDVSGPGTETRWDGIIDTIWDLLPDDLGGKYAIRWEPPSRHVMWGRYQSMALLNCKWIYATSGALLSEPLDPMFPEEKERIFFDLEGPVNCPGSPGVTIASSSWEISPDTDDGVMTIDQPSITEYITGIRVIGGTDGSIYELANTVETSDGRTLIRKCRIPVGIVTTNPLH